MVKILRLGLTLLGKELWLRNVRAAEDDKLSALLGCSTITQAKAEAQKFDLLPLVLEARLAIAEIAASSGNRSEATATARDAAQAGFGLIAAKANTIAQSTKSK